MIDFFDVVLNRRSVRTYNKCDIPDEAIKSMLNCAMSAPSAKNMQPWEFIVIRDRCTMAELAKALPYAKMAAEATVCIVVCAVPARANESRIEYAIIDASIASEHIVLSATALGLGSVWTALYPQLDRMTETKKILGIPAEIIPLSLIPIGEPRFLQKTERRIHNDYVHFERW